MPSVTKKQSQSKALVLLKDNKLHEQNKTMGVCCEGMGEKTDLDNAACVCTVNEGL